MTRTLPRVLAIAVALGASATASAQQQQGYTPPPGYVLVPAAPPKAAPQQQPQQPPPGYVLAPAVQERSWAIGASAGVGFPSRFYVGDADLDTKTGFRFGAYADFFLASRISMGVFVDRLSFGVKDVDATVSFTSLGGTIVGHFGDPNGGHVRAGLGLSYDMGSTDYSSDDSTGLGVRVFAGYQVPVGQGTAIFAQVGVQGSPSGGTGNVDVTYGPMWTLAAGVEFGK